MHSRATVAEALRLRDEKGMGARRAARHLGLPLGTVHGWYQGRLPWHSRRSTSSGSRPSMCEKCEQREHRLGELGSDYVYLLACTWATGASRRIDAASTGFAFFST